MLATPSAALANGIFVLNFEGLLDTEQVAEFYNGGTGGRGSGPGTNYGVSFSVRRRWPSSTPTPAVRAISPTSPLATRSCSFSKAAGWFSISRRLYNWLSFFYTSQTDAIVRIYDGMTPQAAC